jgi:hypothetical protein
VMEREGEEAKAGADEDIVGFTACSRVVTEGVRVGLGRYGAWCCG